MKIDRALAGQIAGLQVTRGSGMPGEGSYMNLRGVRSDAAVWRVLPNLIAQPIINTRYLQRTVGLSKPQAERAIKTLSERGVVMARTGKQRSVVYEHRGILDVLDEYAAGLRRG